MSHLSHKSRKKMRKLNSGRSYGILHSKRIVKKRASEKEQLKQACKSLGIKKEPEDTNTHPTFGRLPEECKIRVFSYLTDTEKCEAAKVCTEWARVMRTPRLWQFANFSQALSRGELPKDKCDAIRCIKDRATNFIYHLVSRRALLKHLEFEMDIVEGEEIWLKFLIYCLKMTNSHDLKVVQAKWTNSPDFMPFRAEERNWKSDRVKSFRSLLLTFSDTSPSIEELYTPFDWSASSVNVLCRFKQLHTLELDKYWVFALFREEHLSQLLDSLPCLKRFKLSVCVPLLGTLSFPQYIMASDSLETLDISCCTGFFLRSVRMPSLVSFTTSRYNIRHMGSL